MKLIIETSGISNLLPSVTIELTRYDLADLVQYGQISRAQVLGRKGDTDYYQETKIIVAPLLHSNNRG